MINLFGQWAPGKPRTGPATAEYKGQLPIASDSWSVPATGIVGLRHARTIGLCQQRLALMIVDETVMYGRRRSSAPNAPNLARSPRLLLNILASGRKAAPGVIDDEKQPLVEVQAVAAPHASDPVLHRICKTHRLMRVFRLCPAEAHGMVSKGSSRHCRDPGP